MNHFKPTFLKQTVPFLKGLNKGFFLTYSYMGKGMKKDRGLKKDEISLSVFDVKTVSRYKNINLLFLCG